MRLNQDKTYCKYYSPFGVTLTERDFTSEKYRYGFNGMEKDDEVKGEGNSYDFGARMYDNRLGKMLSIDNEHAEFPDLSPYSALGNNPIEIIDPDGNKIVVKRKEKTWFRKTPVIKIKVTGKIIDETESRSFSQIKTARDRMESAMEDYYTGEDSDMKWKTKVKLRIGLRGSKSSLKKKDHAFRIVDDAHPSLIKKNKDGVVISGVIGLGDPGQNYVYLANKMLDREPPSITSNDGLTDKGEETLERLVAHEIGHSAGLPHPRENVGATFKIGEDPNKIDVKYETKLNLMNQQLKFGESFTPGTKIEKAQILKIDDAFKKGELNSGVQSKK